MVLTSLAETPNIMTDCNPFIPTRNAVRTSPETHYTYMQESKSARALTWFPLMCVQDWYGLRPFPGVYLVRFNCILLIVYCLFLVFFSRVSGTLLFLFKFNLLVVVSSAPRMHARLISFLA